MSFVTGKYTANKVNRETDTCSRYNLRNINVAFTLYLSTLYEHKHKFDENTLILFVYSSTEVYWREDGVFVSFPGWDTCGVHVHYCCCPKGPTNGGSWEYIQCEQLQVLVLDHISGRFTSLFGRTFKGLKAVLILCSYSLSQHWI